MAGRFEINSICAAKVRLGSYAYACQYLQNPIARGGNLFKQGWFGTYRQIPKFDVLVQSWDCAFKAGQTNDYSACVTIGWVNPNREGQSAAPGFYLVDASRGRVEFPELKRRAQSLYQQWHPSVVLIEDTASGQSLLQELRTVLTNQGHHPRRRQDSARETRSHLRSRTGNSGYSKARRGLEEFIEE